MIGLEEDSLARLAVERVPDDDADVVRLIVLRRLHGCALLDDRRGPAGPALRGGRDVGQRSAHTDERDARKEGETHLELVCVRRVVPGREEREERGGR